MPLRINNELLSCDPVKLCIISQSNSVSWHVLMIWHEFLIIVNQLFGLFFHVTLTPNRYILHVIVIDCLSPCIPCIPMYTLPFRAKVGARAKKRNEARSEKLARHVTALFENMRILKFKSQLTIAFLAAVNHLNGPLRKQTWTLTGSKSHGLWFAMGGFPDPFCVSVFRGSLLVIVVMIDGSEKRNCQGGFELWSSHVCEKRSKAWTTEIFWIFVYSQHVTNAYNPWTA